jgi:hypothetical protein
MADYIPAGDEIFLEWARTLYNYALAHFADWGGIPSPSASIGPLVGAYLTALTAAQKPNRGKHVYLCPRREINREGDKGPDGAIVEVVIP